MRGKEVKLKKGYFWCDNSCCAVPQPIETIAQELNGKRLCQKCYDLGVRLVPTAIPEYPEKLVEVKP